MQVRIKLDEFYTDGDFTVFNTTGARIINRHLYVDETIGLLDEPLLLNCPCIYDYGKHISYGTKNKYNCIVTQLATTTSHKLFCKINKWQRLKLYMMYDDRFWIPVIISLAALAISLIMAVKNLSTNKQSELLQKQIEQTNLLLEQSNKDHYLLNEKIYSLQKAFEEHRKDTTLHKQN